MITRFTNIVRRKPDADNKSSGYDIIGDVHGFLCELEVLLEQMGYTVVEGTWQHPERKAIFVGDFINRGPDSRGVINCIRNMVENGSGLAILGNHELNAITYFSVRSDGKPIRIPSESSKKLLDKLAEEYRFNMDQLMVDIKWLRTLPFHIEIGNMRVVHAYWNTEHIKVLPQLYQEGKLRKKFLKEALKKQSPLYKPLLETTKGIEVTLPADLIVKDSNRISRSRFRIKWWIDPIGKTFRELSYGNRFVLPPYTVPYQVIPVFKVYEKNEPIVFIGHYCALNDDLTPVENVCCVDACVANGGRLAAYRWNGESKVNPSNFMYVNRSPIKKPLKRGSY